MRRNQRSGSWLSKGCGWLATGAALALAAGCAGDTSAGGSTASQPDATPPPAGTDETARIQAFLDARYLRTDVRHTFRASTGQEIDCVDVMAQPGLKNPALRGHVPITSPPASLPPARRLAAAIPRPEDGAMDGSGRLRRCPDGTVPIVSLTAGSIRRVGGLDQYLRHAGLKASPPHPSAAPAPAPLQPALLPQPARRPLAPQVLPPASARFFYGLGVDMDLSRLLCPAPGGGSTLSVSLPHVLAADMSKPFNDHSISQIWLTSPGDNWPSCAAPNCVQSLEAGWNVDPVLYEDAWAHFFIYSTKDGYGLTGCYNMDTTCAGAAGTMTGSGLILIQNPALIPAYTLGGPSITELEVYWYHSPDHNWWLSANHGWVGYIPGSLFANGNGGTAPLGGSDTTKNYYATYFKAGGEVADAEYLLTSTTSDMGTGQFSNLGYPAAAYQRNAIYTSNNCDPDSDQTDLPAPITYYQSNPDLYTVTDTATSSGAPAGGTGWGSFFYFGGPGVTASAPAAPSGLSVSTWDTGVTLRWNAVTGADSYDVHVSTSPTPPSSTDWQFGKISENFWGIEDLTDGMTYYFNVRAVNVAGTSAWSAQSSGVPNPPIPPTPTGLTTRGGVQQVTLSWNPASYAASYTVKDATSATGSLANAKTGITGISYTYTGLQNNKTYYFVVSAQNVSGSSVDSARVSGLTATAAPTGVSATASGGKVTVKWSATSGASSYTVFRSQTAGSPGSAIASGLKTTSYTDAAVTKGTKYYYVVVAVNASGNSTNSTQVSATP